MIEMIYFTLAGVMLYFVSDSILEQIEIRRGGRFAHRDIIFFAIIFILAALLFALIRYFSQS